VRTAKQRSRTSGAGRGASESNGQYIPQPPSSGGDVIVQQRAPVAFSDCPAQDDDLRISSGVGELGPQLVRGELHYGQN
jgi:hypothetical protein